MRRESFAPQMIDLHNHLVAGIDDGPAGVDSAVRLAAAMRRDGTRTAVATPHVSRRWPNDAAAIARGVAELRRGLEAAAIGLDVRAGAEVELVVARSLGGERLAELTIAGGRWLLVEMPHAAFPFGLEDVADSLESQGLGAVIAHPEINPHVQRRPELLRPSIRAGAVAQVTCSSLLGELGRPAEETAWRLIEMGLAHMIASDAHDARRRPPAMTAGRQVAERRLGAGMARALTEDVPRGVLESAPATELRGALPPVAARRRRRPRIFGR